MINLYLSSLNNYPYIRQLEENFDTTDFFNDDSNEPFDSNLPSYFLTSDLESSSEIDSSSIIDNSTKYISNKTIPMTLLQVQVKNNSLNLYFMSEPINVTLSVTISIYLNNNFRRNLQDTSLKTMTILVKKINKLRVNKEEISQYTTDDEEFMKLIEQYEEGAIRIVVTKIEDSNGKNTDFKLDVTYKDNADSEKNQNVDFSLIISKSPESNYDFKVYEVQEVSACSSEFQFNLTVDNNIEGSDANITLTFNMNITSISFGGGILPMGGGAPRGNIPSNISNFRPPSASGEIPAGTPRFGPSAQCILSSKNKKIIVCVMERETLDVNFTMNNYFSFDEKQLISITADKNFEFPLYCHEESPLAAIIFISAVFLFVVIVVIIIIIFMNKKGRGDKGYDAPNNINGDNVIGLSSGNISKA